MVGGFTHQEEITQEQKDLVASHLAQINAKHNSHATSFHVDAVFTQVVAGTNYFFHLTANDGSKLSVSVFVPLPHTNAPSELNIVEAGHTEARNHNN